MIAAALGALAMLVGVVAPFEGGTLQIQSGHGDVLYVLETTGLHRDGDNSSGMKRFVFPNFFIGDTKDKVNCWKFSSNLSIQTPEITFEGHPFGSLGCGYYFYNVRSAWEYNIIPGILVDEFPRTIGCALADRFERIILQSVLNKEPRLEFCLGPNKSSWGTTSILNCKSDIDRQVPVVISQGTLDSWNDLKPRPLFLPHFSKLPTCGVGLPFGLGCQVRQIAYGGFDVRGVGDRPSCQSRDRQRSEAHKERQPFADSEAAQKIAGWITVCIATIVGAIGAACLVGALGGRDFDLSWRERARYAIAGIILCAVAAWLVIHVAAPIVDS
jgi:hypothetical protein